MTTRSTLSSLYRLQKVCGMSLLIALLNGCSLFIGSATQNFSENLRQTLLKQEDPELVMTALPTYLLTLEAMVDEEASPDALFNLANLGNAYLSLLPEEDNTRKAQLSHKNLAIALRAACLYDNRFCKLQEKTPNELQIAIENTDRQDLEPLYALATSWAGWIQNHKSDWNAIAQLAQVKSLMQRIVAIDPLFKQGNPHLYLGVLESLIPAHLGGQPDVAKAHFEQAMLLAPDNLMVPVFYAKHYARMAFDRDLHDRLLKSVLAANPRAAELTLINTLAQHQARSLLNSADQYF